MENYIRIYATNIKIRKAQTKETERGGGEQERKQKGKTKTNNYHEECVGGHVMGRKKKKKNCNRKIIPQQWICTQQYLFEPSGME